MITVFNLLMGQGNDCISMDWNIIHKYKILKDAWKKNGKKSIYCGECESFLFSSFLFFFLRKKRGNWHILMVSRNHSYRDLGC